MGNLGHFIPQIADGFALQVYALQELLGFFDGDGFNEVRLDLAEEFVGNGDSAKFRELLHHDGKAVEDGLCLAGKSVVIVRQIAAMGIAKAEMFVVRDHAIGTHET